MKSSILGAFFVFAFAKAKFKLMLSLSKYEIEIYVECQAEPVEAPIRSTKARLKFILSVGLSLS